MTYNRSADALRKEAAKFRIGFVLIGLAAFSLSGWSIVSRAPEVFFFACVLVLFFFGLFRYRPSFPAKIVTHQDWVTFVMPDGKTVEFRSGDEVHVKKPLGRPSVSIGPFQLVRGETKVTLDEGYEGFSGLVRDLYRLFPECKEKLAYWTAIPE